jgi:SAM-dependent methyltransferase
MTTIWQGTFRKPRYWNAFGERLVQLAGLSPGARVLDVGTGGGAVLLPAADAVAPAGRAVGIDIWGPSVSETRGAIAQQGLPNATVMQMDARQLAFCDGCFDTVLSGFVGWDDVFDFQREQFIDPDHILAESFRVLREGGQVGVSGWAMQEDSEWMGQLIHRYLPAEGGRNGEPSGTAPLCYSKETAAGWHVLLGRAGFRDGEIRTERREFAYRDEGEWVAVMERSGWGKYLEQIRQLPRARRLSFENDVITTLQEHRGKRGIHFRRTVIFAFGIK